MPRSDLNADVVVIGCGPTGATLANLLSLCGVKVLVLEKEPDVYDLPRAVHFDDETMRVFQTVGIANQLKKKTRVNPGMQFVDADGTLILDWPRPSGIGKHGWHTSYRLHQPDLEKLLRTSLTTYSSSTLKLGHRVVELQQLNDHVNVVYENCASGDQDSVNAQYVVGCDGSNSFVRQRMTSAMEDFGFNQRWLVVDVLLKREMPELGDYTKQFCDPAQPMTYCRNPGNRRRWEMALTDDMKEDEALDSTRIWSLLSRWISAADATLERKAIYTFRSALAECWQRDRLLIAGDAAHLTPPFMGQGMCTGIRDAANLAWKLSTVIKQSSLNPLLSSYQLERSPHARQYIDKAMMLGKLMNSIDKRAHADTQNGPVSGKMNSIEPTLGNTTTGRFGIELSAELSLYTGQLFSQPMLADGRLLDDHCGYRAALIVLNDSIGLRKPSNELFHVSGEDHPQVAHALTELRVSAVLIRPDKYIVASASTGEGIASLVELSKQFI